MDTQDNWQAFVCTGNILRYLDYRLQMPSEKRPTGGAADGTLCHDGTGPAGDNL